MTYPIILEPGDGGYTATTPFWPSLRVRAATREATLAAAREALQEHLRQGKVVMLDIGEDPWVQMAGRYAADDLGRIVAEAYAARDTERVL